MKFFLLILALLGSQIITFSQNFSISGGHAFSVALSRTGEVYTWGSNSNGELCLDSIGGFVTTPQKIIIGNSGMPAITKIDAGSLSHVVALACDGSVWTWGNNCNGQLGNGEGGGQNAWPASACSTARAIPQKVKTGEQEHVSTFLSDVISISSGSSQSYAILKNGRLVSWGGNSYGELGAGLETKYSNVPVYVKRKDTGGFLENVIAVDAQDFAGYALTSDGQVWSWGDNAHSSLGNPMAISNENMAIQVQVDLDGDNIVDGPLNKVVNITAGDTHGLFLDTKGNVWSVGGDWGSGQRGNPIGGYNNQKFATKVLAGQAQDSIIDYYLSNVTQIAASKTASAAIVKINGWSYAMTWGGEEHFSAGGASTGVLGLGVPGDKLTPYFVTSFQDGDVIYPSSRKEVIEISDGDGVFYFITYDHITNEQEIWVTGSNNYGQLGLGYPTNKHVIIPTKLHIPNFEIAYPCPTAKILTKEIPNCTDNNITLYASITNNAYLYKWTKDGIDISNQSFDNGSKINTQGFGKYKISITPKSPLHCETCIEAEDSITIPNTAIDTLYSTYTDTTVVFKIKNSYDNYDIFSTENDVNPMSVQQVQTSKNEYSFYIPQSQTQKLNDTVNSVWIRKYNLIEGTLGSQDSLVNTSGGYNKSVPAQKIISYKDFILKNITFIGSSIFPASTTFKVVLYENKIINGIDEPDYTKVLKESDTLVKNLIGKDTKHEIELEIKSNKNDFIIPSSKNGLKIWITIQNMNNDLFFFANSNSTSISLPLHKTDDIDKKTAWIYDNAARIDNLFYIKNSFCKIKIAKKQSLACNKTQLLSQKKLLACKMPNPVYNSIISGHTNAVNIEGEYICEKEEITLTPNIEQFNNNDFKYTWYKGDTSFTNKVIGKENIINATYLPLQLKDIDADFYILHIEDRADSKCFFDYGINIPLKKLPTSTFNKDSSICEDKMIPQSTLNLVGNTPFSLLLQTPFGISNFDQNDTIYKAAHLQNKAGQYKYTLQSISDKYCKGVITDSTQTITINKTPQISFEPSSNIMCNTGKPILISTITNDSIIIGNWSGNGVTKVSEKSALFNPDATGLGNFTIYYSVTNSNNCNLNTFKPITVYNAPPKPEVTNAIHYTYNQPPIKLSTSESNVKWYTSITDNVGSYSAPTPITSIYGSQKYWVSQYDNNCVSEKALITVYVDQVLQLNKGWNIFSLTVNPEHNSIDSIFKGNISYITVIKDFDNYYYPGYQYNLKNLSPGKGYLIQVNDALQISISGEQITPTQIPLTYGWNLIGYSKSSSDSTIQILGDNWPQVKTIKNFEEFKDQTSGTLNTMKPGDGYYIFMNKDASLKY